MKKVFKQIGWIFTLSVLLLTGCQQEDILYSLPENGNVETEAEIETHATDRYNYLAKTNGIFILSEGNMSNENGTLSFINATSTYSARNWIYRSANPNKEIGNVAQDMFISNNKVYIVSQNGHKNLEIAPGIFNDRGANHILIANTNMTRITDFNPGNYFTSNWSSSEPTPTHLAVNGNNIYVRTNINVVRINETTPNATPVIISGISNPSRTRMAMVKNGTTKYLYVGSTDNRVYRLNTSTNQVSSIPVQGKVAGLVAVRRNNNTNQYIWALCIKSDGTGVLHKISGTAVQVTRNITMQAGESNPFDANLFIPSVGLCCDARGSNDVLYFRGNSWSPNPTKIYKFNSGSSSTTAVVFYTLASGIDSQAQVIYGDLGVDPNNGNVYFGYVGDWGYYASINGVVRLSANGSVLKEYRASYTSPNKIDSRFTAGIYFRREFNM